MQVLLNSINEEFPAVILGIEQTFTLDCRSNSVDNSINIFSLEEIGNFT